MEEVTAHAQDLGHSFNGSIDLPVARCMPP